MEHKSVHARTAGARYHLELARQLADFLEGGPVAPLRRAGGLMPLGDVYCLFNRARGGLGGRCNYRRLGGGQYVGGGCGSTACHLQYFAHGRGCCCMPCGAGTEQVVPAS